LEVVGQADHRDELTDVATGVQVEGLTRVLRDLRLLGLDVSDLKSAFSGISKLGASLATGFAPRRSGALAADIRGSRARSRASVLAGGARVPYAGPINYGWTARGIAASGFMQRADEALRNKAPNLLVKAINNAIIKRGLQ
jgi:hypothetical protein